MIFGSQLQSQRDIFSKTTMCRKLYQGIPGVIGAYNTLVIRTTSQVQAKADLAAQQVRGELRRWGEQRQKPQSLASKSRSSELDRAFSLCDKIERD